MNRKYILYKVKIFLAEYILFSAVCIIGIALAWRYHNHIGMFVIAVPTFFGYLLVQLYRLLTIFQDLYMDSIVVEEIRILSFVKRRFELFFIKSFYKIEVCNNSTYKNQKKILIMMKYENIESNGTCKITYLQHSKIVINLESI